MNYVPSDMLSAGYICLYAYFALCYQCLAGVLLHLKAAFNLCCYAIYYVFLMFRLKTAICQAVQAKPGAGPGSTAGRDCLIIIPRHPCHGAPFVRGGGVKNGL